ncbi:hypothetical protein JHK87_012234 [Glycine soja]|nr:hypothetical protein JHK87_012234 [Glycine soja]
MAPKFTYDLLCLFKNTYGDTSNLTFNGSPVHNEGGNSLELGHDEGAFLELGLLCFRVDVGRELNVTLTELHLNA